MKWNFKKADWSSFRKDCQKIITLEKLDNKEDKMQAFTDTLMLIAEDHIKLKNTSSKKRGKPWFDEDCIKAKRDRNNANRTYKRHPKERNKLYAIKMIANAR